MPKALHFSQDEIKLKTHPDSDKGCDMHSQSMDSSTQPLKLLRLSSLEEDGTSEDTLDSDVIGAEDSKDDDGDVVMGIPRPSRMHLSVDKSNLSVNKSRKDLSLDVNEENVASENVKLGEKSGCAKPNVPANDGCMTDVTKESLGIVENDTKRNEGDPGSGLQDCKDGINTEACREDKNEEYDAGVKNVNTKSQLTEYNEATTSATGSSSVGQAKDQSSMEKTLAFFLDTPPQRRLKLKRASDASKVNHDKESENSNQIGYDRTKTVAEINVRPHDCQSDTPVTVASQDEDRYRKQKFEPDKSNLALDNNEAKLGECESRDNFQTKCAKETKV